MNGMGGMVVHLRLRIGRKEESNGRRPCRLATMFLGLMYITDPLAMIQVVNRMSCMNGVVVKTIRSCVTFLET